jgi:FAD:protein FMN transferase
MKYAVLPALLLLGSLPHAACAADVEIRSDATLTTLRGPAFGTAFHVKRPTPADPQQNEALAAQIGEVIDRFNEQMSLWHEDSELSRFNRHAAGEWLDVAPETLEVVEAALRIRQASGGAFDPTIRPLLSLWSFGPEQRPRQIPNDEQIDAALSLVGQVIETRSIPAPALRKPADGVELDLNAIAKGYAVDVIAELVAADSPQGGMVEIGGEVVAFGTKPDGTPWRIAIEQPLTGTRTAASYIELQDAALATSGDYRNYFEQDGRRFSHTIDPRTGRPIDHALASVSVVADDCMTADAWATALMVLGPDEGYNIAQQQGLAALFLVREGSTFAVRATPGFPPLIPIAAPADAAPMDASWTTFLIAGGVFLIAVAGMAIGVIVAGRRLRGSCGGLNGLKDAQGNPMCDACTTPPEQCDEFRKQMAANESAAGR